MNRRSAATAVAALSRATLYLSLRTYIELRAESGHDPSSELLCVLSPNLIVRVSRNEMTIPELDDAGVAYPAIV